MIIVLKFECIQMLARRFRSYNKSHDDQRLNIPSYFHVCFVFAYSDLYQVFSKYLFMESEGQSRISNFMPKLRCKVRIL